MLFRSNTFLTRARFDPWVDLIWFLVVAIIVWLVTAQAFPALFPEQSSIAGRITAVMVLIGLFFSLLLPRITRTMAKRRWRIRPNQEPPLRFSSLGAWNDLSPSAQILISLTGQATSLAISAVFAALYGLTSVWGIAPPVPQIAGYLSAINIAVAAFALLPVPPLDGGHMLWALLLYFGGRRRSAEQARRHFGIAFAVISALVGLALIFVGPLSLGLGLVLLGALALVPGGTRQIGRSIDVRLVADIMTPNPVTATPDMTLSHIINQVVLRHQVHFLPVVEDGQLLGKIDSSLLARIDREHWNSTKANDVFADLSTEWHLRADTPVDAVIDLIACTGQRKFLVTEGDRLVGVLTLADLTEAIFSRNAALHFK